MLELDLATDCRDHRQWGLYQYSACYGNHGMLNVGDWAFGGGEG
jgi:hypothetical protein